MPNGIDLIKARRAQIRQEKAKHVEAIANLDAEDADLAHAEQVVARLERQGPQKVFIPRPYATIQQKSQKSIPRKGTPRPKDIPTTRAMIDTVLAEAEARGKKGLAGKEIMLEIDGRWWPGVGWTSILPDAHRLVTKSKVLRKEGNLFVRVNKDEAPPDLLGGAS